MATISDIALDAQLAFASYAVLSPGIVVDISPLTAAGMNESQARTFASEWHVVDQYTSANGLSATVFQKMETGKRFLAIRGTELSPTVGGVLDLGADLVLAAGIPQYLNPQYASLNLKVRAWLADGTLSSGFSVTGHSLGGYLAGAVGVDFSRYVSAVYQYNAPGLGGVVAGNAYEALKQALSLGNIPVLANTYNLRGSRGLSVIASLGAQFAPPTAVEIEGAPGLGLDNHVIARISDSLSVYALLAQFNPNLTYRQISEIVAASSVRDADTLESTLYPLLRSVGMESVRFEDRDALWGAIENLKRAATVSPSPLEVRTLVGVPVSELLAQSRGDNGFAYRNALKALDPYVVLGKPADVSGPNAENDVTQEYLADRASMLRWKNQHFIADGLGVLRGDVVETYKYADHAIVDSGGNSLSLTVRGSQIGSVGIPAFITFGSDRPDALTGGNVAVGDHLYGGGGDDTLDGQGGADYLEGNAGKDTLKGGTGSDTLAGGTGFDTYIYNEGDDLDILNDTDGAGEIIYNGRTLNGGSKIGEGVYEDASGVEFMLLDDGAGGQDLLVDGSIYVEDFVEGALGIHLQGEVSPPEPPEPPESPVAHVYVDSQFPEDYDPLSDDGYGFVRNLYGSSGEDFFQTSGLIDAFGRAGNDIAVFMGEGTYGNQIDMGAGDDVIYANTSAGSEGAGRLAGGGGDDYISGSQGPDSIWGDNYLAISQKIGYGSAAHFADRYLIDSFRYNASSALGTGIFRILPPLYGGFAQILSDVNSIGLPFSEISNSVLVPDGGAFSGDLGGAIAFLLGDAATFDDYIDAGDGDDYVIGGSGADAVYGGAGNDILTGDYGYGYGSNGVPTYFYLPIYFGAHAALFGRPGDDYLDGDDGNDTIRDTDGGNDILIGGEGGDVIESRETAWIPADGRGARNTIHAGPGNDTVTIDNRTGGFDVVDGGGGDDLIEVDASRYFIDEDDDGIPESVGTSSGRAIVFGGSGNDVLRVFAEDAIVDGGSGDDVYTIWGGSVDITDGAGEDMLHMFLTDLASVDASMEAFPQMNPEDEAELDASDQQRGTLVARDGSDLVYTDQLEVDGIQVTYGQLRFSDWFVGAANRIEHIAVGGSDDPVLTSAQFESWGGLHFGGGAGDALVNSSEYSDRAFGHGGNDLISTGAGADRISGGRGDDELHGGSGNDTYYFALGDGHDVVHETSGFDEIRFGPGISASEVAITLDDSGITVACASGTIEVAGGTRADPGIERLRFTDGSTVSLAELLGPEPTPPADTGPDANPEPQGSGSGDGQGAGASGADSAGAAGAMVETANGTAVPNVASGPGDGGFAASAPDAPAPPSNAPFSPEPDLLSKPYTPDPSPVAFGLSVQDDARALAVAPLDLETLLDAVQAFDTTTSEEVPGKSSNTVLPGQSLRDQTSAPTASPAVTSWVLTNALLEFHLGRPDSVGAADGVVERYGENAALAGIGAGQGALLFGPSAFGRSSQSLPTFSGLQEGFLRLA